MRISVTLDATPRKVSSGWNVVDGRTEKVRKIGTFDVGIARRFLFEREDGVRRSQTAQQRMHRPRRVNRHTSDAPRDRWSISKELYGIAEPPKTANRNALRETH